MGAEWKRKLKPNVVLYKIDGIKTVLPDGRVSYSGFEYHDAMATLQGMVEFPRDSDDLDKQGIVARAVSRVAKAKALDEQSVMNEINVIIKEARACKEGIYFVLTSISLKKPYPGMILKSEGATIRISDRPFPKRFSGRDDVLKNRHSFEDATPKGYAKVVVQLKAKSERAAASGALKAIDLQRAIWCLFGNSSMELIGSASLTPINKVRLGSAHTVHNEGGKVTSDSFWYEPNFSYANPFANSNTKIVIKNAKFINERLHGHPYGEVIKSALLRYVRALDDKDQNVALLRLWGAIEELASPGVANYDLVVRRVSFLFSERDYHEQVMEHLRDYRNRNVHSGEQDERARTGCYQLQAYFHRLVMFHIKGDLYFSSLDEANAFLDLPSNVDVLKRRKELIEKAIKFVVPVA